MIVTLTYKDYCNFPFMNSEIEFPLYRKYKNDKSFFKVTSDSSFEEITFIKEKATFHLFNAKILPDRNYIFDMIYNYEPYWNKSNKEEFEEAKSKI